MSTIIKDAHWLCALSPTECELAFASMCQQKFVSMSLHVRDMRMKLISLREARWSADVLYKLTGHSTEFQRRLDLMGPPLLCKSHQSIWGR